MKIPSQPPYVATTKPSVGAPKSVEPVAKLRPEYDPTTQVQKPFVERRKNNRRQHCAARGPYDLRCGRDRRKGLRKGRLIEIDV